MISCPEALETWDRRRREVLEDVFRPSPHLTPSECAAEHRVISLGPEVGQRWTNEMTPYLVEILDFIGAPWATRGVVRKSARVGYTEGVIHNAVLYTVHMDPCPIAIVQPSDDEAKDYSREQIKPLFDYNPVLSDRIGKRGRRASDSTLTHMEFDLGYLSILGAESDKNARRRSYKRMLIDEVDAISVSAGEGDKIKRFEKRTADYVDDGGVTIVGSTPTLAKLSRIDREFQKSDQRYYHVPCPRCREFQVLIWGDEKKPHGIRWAKALCCRSCGTELEEGAVHCPECLKAEFVVRNLAETAHYVCEHCGEMIEEHEKEAMVRAGRWIATNPLGEFPGWHIDALISLFPMARWSTLVSEWLEALLDQGDLQVFYNQVLGLAFEETVTKVDASALERRAEEHVDRAGRVCDVPDGVGVLTAFCDVQGSWLELLVRGWGINEESWDVLHERIPGDPEMASTWAKLDALLTRSYRHECGGQMRIATTLIDAAAYHDAVCRFVKPREPRMVFASMGDKTGAPDHVEIKAPSKANAQGVRVYMLGTYRLKTRLFERLALPPGPKFMHLRTYNADRCNGFDAEYFAQAESEKRVTRRVKGSRNLKSRYIATRDRNEFVDLHVGNMGAYLVTAAPVRAQMAKLVELARGTPAPVVPRQRRVVSPGVEV